MAYTLFSSSDASTQTTGMEIEEILAEGFALPVYTIEEHVYHQHPDEVDDSSTVCTDDDIYEWDDPNAVYEWY